ncbi:AbrB/MazE/SpoVT family DNA-binding domain-containing protein [Streptomyces sp. NPDC058947]|uniref:AbrB/MazE/SpoVT family DNA-binding domain-containing protein n=1 Tax=Streptomyces sp. NPDC058947 TaxID=3346675 RepID=UPI0036C773A3
MTNPGEGENGSFRTTVGLRGRMTIPSDIQAKAGIGVGDTVAVRAAGDGVVVIETLQAVKNRIRSEALNDRKEKENGDQGAEEQ